MGVAPLKIESQKLNNANLGETFRFGLLQKISIQLYKLIKKKLPHNIFILFRKLYYRMNGKSIHHIITEDAVSFLKPILSPHLKALDFLLKERGYINLPKWLEQR